MSRIFIWLESSSTLNLVSERDSLSLFLSLSLSLFLSLSLALRGAGILEKNMDHKMIHEKNKYLSQHTMRVSTCIIHVH